MTAPSELLPISGHSSSAHLMLQKPCRTLHVGRTESRKGVFLSWVQSGPKGKEWEAQRGVWGAGVDTERGREVGLEPGWSGVWVGYGGGGMS